MVLMDKLADTMVINFVYTIKLCCFSKLAFKRHKTDPLLSSSKRQAA
jgi:hypothetical protein